MGDNKCIKLKPKEHILAFVKNHSLVRETKATPCNHALLEKITSNYIIVKKILSHLQWQDQLICKSVSKIWYDAVKALQRELLGPKDYVVDLRHEEDNAVMKLSGSLSTEPLAVFTFTNFTGFCKMSNCTTVCPSPCDQPCKDVHWLIDCIDQELCYPMECNLIVRAVAQSYLPLPPSITSSHVIKRNMLSQSAPFVCGMYIPKIPDVQYQVINVKANGDMRKDFFDLVDKVAETSIFKGILVFVTDKYLLNSQDDIVFLSHFQKLQPDTPFALGGCIVDDTVYERSDLQFFINNINTDVTGVDFISENVVSLAMFTIPKTLSSDAGSFEMYSFVVESSEWTKPKILKSIKEFSESVPRYENTVVFKLSCVGRDDRHDFEQNTFRSFFPNTPLIGCYGNGEIGLNHPTRPQTVAPPNTVKRLRRDKDENSLLYSYSTVFVYLGWGKVL